MTVACRFAPSPTGALHLGGARTALFNWAFAKNAGGAFLLRIEDTDRSRSTTANEQAILEALHWLGMDPDGVPVRQSERLQIYQSRANELLEQGNAYRCFATPQELDELRASQEARGEKPRYDRRWRDRTDHPDKPFCIRFATPLEGVSQIDDVIRGQVTVDNKELDDPVILRADGTATYNFAAAVDDAAMEITHIIRGEDHLTNTIRQLHIHKALGSKELVFAHLPMILGPKLDDSGNPILGEDGKTEYERLSKRKMAIDIARFRQDGFLPNALVNYLAQLGWTQPGAEIYTPADLVREFNLAKVNRSAARFDMERLRWINHQHMRGMAPAKLAAAAGLDAPDQAIEVACEKARTLQELAGELFWLDPPQGSEQALLDLVTDANRAALTELCAALPELDEFVAAKIKTAIKESCQEHSLKFPQLGMPLRVALTGRTQSPDIALVAEILGRDECRRRLDAALDLLS